MEHCRLCKRRVSGSRKLDWCTIRPASCKRSFMGSYHTKIQEHQGCIRRESGNRRSGLCTHSILPRTVSADYTIPTYRMCLGCHVGMSIHSGYQCTAGVWTHGRLSGTLQRHNLCATDCSCTAWWHHSHHSWKQPGIYDDCFWHPAGSRCSMRIWNQE